MASQRNGTLYAGSTEDLHQRYLQHRAGDGSEFTGKYLVHHLVWFEIHDTRLGAFTRERRIKEWRRSWKVMLIEALNPDWLDLGERFADLSPFDLMLELKGLVKVYCLADLEPGAE